MVFFSFGNTHAFEHSFISFCSSCYLFLSWSFLFFMHSVSSCLFLFVLSIFYLFQLSSKFHLISLETDWCYFLFSIVLFMVISLQYSCPVRHSLDLFCYITFISIYFPSFSFTSIPDILVISPCLSLEIFAYQYINFSYPHFI